MTSSPADQFREVVAFHGHECPGACLGVRASGIVLGAMGRHSKHNQLIAVVETNLCETDAIQYLTGCTFGKRNLIHRDHGKSTYTFWRPSDGKAIRLAARPDSAAVAPPDVYDIHDRIHAGTATAQDQARFDEIQKARQQLILKADDDQLFTMEDEVATPPPVRQGLRAPVPCSSCGEITAGTHVEWVHGQPLCPPCLAARG